MRACLLSITAIADDSRVRRQGDALAAAGYEVTGVGLAGARSPRPGWPIYECSSSASIRRVGTAMRALAARGGTRAAVWAFWTSPLSRRIRETAIDTGAQLFIANDWKALPIALAAAERTGGRVHYDSHEFATDQHLDSLGWRAVMRPFVKAIEGAHIRKAASVSTVAEGISVALEELYQLQERPTVIRNVPPHQSFEARPTASPITVLFHGALTRNRGLELIIESTRLWPEDFRLLIRGSGARRYEARLRALVVDAGVTDRVVFEAAVPPDAVVETAHGSDVGIALFGRGVESVQLSHALPNKLFEYIAAGLALCVLDLPGMGGVVRDYELGWTFPAPRPECIAQAIRQMDRTSIDARKKQALEAAKVLNWEYESRRLVELLSSQD